MRKGEIDIGFFELLIIAGIVTGVVKGFNARQESKMALKNNYEQVIQCDKHGNNCEKLWKKPTAQFKTKVTDEQVNNTYDFILLNNKVENNTDTARLSDVLDEIKEDNEKEEKKKSVLDYEYNYEDY